MTQGGSARRRFFAIGALSTLSTVGAALLALRPGRGKRVIAAGATAPVAAADGGYHETAHIAAYYRSMRM